MSRLTELCRLNKNIIVLNKPAFSRVLRFSRNSVFHLGLVTLIARSEGLERAYKEGSVTALGRLLSVVPIEIRFSPKS